MAESTFGIHWLSFVASGTKEMAFTLYDLLFKELFGELLATGYSGRGFKEIWHSLFEFKVYVSPKRGDVEYFHFEIPGQACEFIPLDLYQGLEDLLRHNYPDEYHYTRIDAAFDHLAFTPEDVEAAICNEQVRSLTKRKNLVIHKSPFELKDNGEMGTYTVVFGSRWAERLIRVYNRRGFTRLEMQVTKDRADLVAKQLFGTIDVSEWYPIMVSHLRDFVDFRTKWWEEFVQGIGRARAVVSKPKEVSETKITRWLERQVAPALSVINDIRPDDVLKDLVIQGRVKRGTRYDLLLANTQPKIDFYDDRGRRVWKKAEDESQEEGKP